MADMLGKSGKWHYCHPLPNGGWVGGLPIPGRRARRIARAREKRAWREQEKKLT